MAFKFNISLEVLNHLGRGLYRSFATVVAEAISNSWDAEATEVYIVIDRHNSKMTIQDNGKGMNEDDFQNKFLKIGYARRDDKDNKSRRKVLGRKGIGKLALLSIAETITINTKKRGHQETGAIIHNPDLDQAIQDGRDSNGYSLRDLSAEKMVFNDKKKGTCLTFENIKERINNPELVKKYLAIIFNFSISSPREKFDIYVNDEKVDRGCLAGLYEKTEYLWNIGNKKDEMLENRLNNLDRDKENIPEKVFNIAGQDYKIQGYIASVEKPRDLAIHGTKGEYRAKLNLFVNGRLRQEDIFDDLESAQVPVNYFYGEIHVDAFDSINGDEDIFTSSREGVIKDDPRYREFLDNIQEIHNKVVGDWRKWRKKTNPPVPPELIDENTLKYMRPGKRKGIEKLSNIDQTGDIPEQVRAILPWLVPEHKSDKRLLICHAGEDKELADKIEEELLSRGISPNEILYTSSRNSKSNISKLHTDIFEYIRKFFIQDFYLPPLIIFVVSEEMEKSWGASLEAGAAWVISEDNVEQFLTVKHGHRPKPPLNPREIFISFDKKGEFEDPHKAKDLLDQISTRAKN